MAVTPDGIGMTVTQFETRGGARVYQMPVETFPGHVNNIYLILDGDVVTLFDVGSGLPDSNEGLERRMAEVRERFGEVATLASVQHVVISHAHIDHFGWVGRFTGESDAAVYVHELDARVLVNFEERIVLASKDLRVFMERAGVKPELRTEIEEAYRWSKNFFKSVEIDHLVRDRDRIINGIACTTRPGTVQGRSASRSMISSSPRTTCCSRITPHQSPAAITPFCGLELYLQSLDKVRGLEGIRVSLPGHEAPIEDLDGRIAGIVSHHQRRLSQVLDICREPLALVEVSKRLFGPRVGYTRLLALEEAGAHVEYLFQRGELRIANLEDVHAGE